MSSIIYVPEKETRPWFKLFPADILSSEEAGALSNAAFGVHMKLLFRAWQDTGVPADPKTLCRLTHSDPREWDAIWAEIESLWPESEHRRRYNQFIESVRTKTTEETERSKKAGKKSAESRTEKFGTANPRANQCEPEAAAASEVVPAPPVMPRVPKMPSAPVLTWDQQRIWREVTKHYADHPDVIEDLKRERDKRNGAELDAWLEEQWDVFRFDD